MGGASSHAVGPLAGHFPYLGCGFSTSVTKSLGIHVPKSFNCEDTMYDSPRTLRPVPASKVSSLLLSTKSCSALGHACGHQGPHVSHRRSSHRPFTNVALSLTHRISGCDSGYAPEREALGILLLVTDTHSIPLPDLCPHGAFYTCYLSYPGSFYLRGLSIFGEAPRSPSAAPTKTVRGK